MILISQDHFPIIRKAVIPHTYKPVFMRQCRNTRFKRIEFLRFKQTTHKENKSKQMRIVNSTVLVFHKQPKFPLIEPWLLLKQTVIYTTAVSAEVPDDRHTVHNSFQNIRPPYLQPQTYCNGILNFLFSNFIKK